MRVLIIAALVAFGGYIITIPRLIWDEWRAWRVRKAEETKSPIGDSEDHSEVQPWKPLITT